MTLLSLLSKVNLQRTVYVQRFILPHWGKILHGQCPCIRDKTCLSGEIGGERGGKGGVGGDRDIRYR